MKNDQITEKIAKITAEFQSETNSVKKMMILHKYMDFLKTEDKLKKMFAKDDCKADKTLKSLIDGTATLNDLKINLQAPNFLNDTSYFYCFFDTMYNVMEDYKKTKDKEKIKKLQLSAEKAFSTPAQSMMFIIAFDFLNKKIINKLETENFVNSDKAKKLIHFDSDKSVLFFKDKKIKIKRKADFPLEHYILESLFEQKDKNEEVYYQDIAEDKLKELNYDNCKDWKKYYRACQRLQDKIRVDTKIDDFIIFTTGKTGNVRINKKYHSLLK